MWAIVLILLRKYRSTYTISRELRLSVCDSLNSKSHEVGGFPGRAL
jgi:hypothetical protein